MRVKELFSAIDQKYPQLKSQWQNVEEIIGEYTQLSWSELKLKPDFIINHESLGQIEDALVRLANGEPAAYILGYKHFYKSKFKVGPGVLIPRAETEILVEAALASGSQFRRVADLGAGSGCIGLSLAREWPGAEIHLFEKSEPALALCRDNHAQLGLHNVQLHGSEVTDQLPLVTEPFDLVVANPPYIAEGDPRVELSVKDYEPHSALYSGSKGLTCIDNWLLWVARNLTDGGHYFFEFGQNQESEILKLIDQNQFRVEQIIEDYQGIPRVFHLQKIRSVIS